jgi:hypothetical protein
MGSGRTFSAPNFDAVIAVSDTAELYDPVTGQWEPTAKMNAFRYGHSATLLANGEVLVVGGWVFGGNLFGGNRSSTELYNDEYPVLALSSPTYCIGAPWNLRVQSLAPDSSIRLVGASNSERWEIADWRKTDDSGNYTETAAFPPGSEGNHTLYVDIDGRVSNAVSFSVTRCEIQLTLEETEYCTGDSWNLKITSDFSNALINLSGSTNNVAWEVANWRRTESDGTFSEVGTFASGSEGSHRLRVRIGPAQSNLFSFKVSRC